MIPLGAFQNKTERFKGVKMNEKNVLLAVKNPEFLQDIIFGIEECKERNEAKFKAGKIAKAYKGLTVKYEKLIPYLQENYELSKEEVFEAINELARRGSIAKTLSKAGVVLYLPEDYTLDNAASYAELIANRKRLATAKRKK